MRNRSEIVGALDLGSRNVRAIIARKDEDGTVQIVGHGIAPGKGCVFQGVIQDLNAAKVALKHAIADAEKEARMHLSSYFCGINGRNVETFIREGNVKLDREVVEIQHMHEALDIASRDVLQGGKRVISSIASQEWYVDDLRVIDPLELRGHVLKTRVHFARFPSAIEDNIVHCIESQRRELEDIIFLPIASALGCLTPEDMELGVAVLDMGRATTGLAVYRDRRVLGTHSFEWGGYHLTRDLSAGLHVSFEEADELILEYGISDEFIERDEDDSYSALLKDRTSSQIKLKTAVHGTRTIVPREELDMIVYERANELLAKVRQHLHSRGLNKHLVRGVVLTGGTARIKNVVKLAERIFQVPCRIGVPACVEIMPSSMKTPEFSAVVGVARHGLEYRSSKHTSHALPNGPVATSVRVIGNVVRKYFF